MRIAICDDDSEDINLIQSYCDRFDSRIPVQAFTCGEDLLIAYNNTYFDIVFLDIEMDGMNGLEVGAELIKMSVKPIVVFTTQSLNYAVRGYGIALRYLPKPISFETFSQTISLALSKLLPQKISIVSGGNQFLISTSNILYFEILRHQLILHLESGQCMYFRGTLTEIISQLPGGNFAQPHKSYYVNLDYVDRLTPQKIIMTNHDIIPIGRSKKDEFSFRLGEYMKGRQTNEHWN